MIRHFAPGDFVVTAHPSGDNYVLVEERRRTGMVVGHVPAGVMGNFYAVTQLLVFWTGPQHHGKRFTLEPDHRVKHVL